MKDLDGFTRDLLGLAAVPIPAEAEQALYQRFCNVPYCDRHKPDVISERLQLIEAGVSALDRYETRKTIDQSGDLTLKLKNLTARIKALEIAP